MRVLVTGHKGYVGNIMVPMLLDEGFDVTGLDSNFYNEIDRDVTPQVPCIRKDIRDVESKDLRGFDAVIHLAALSNDPLGNFDPQLTYDINEHASIRLAKQAKKWVSTVFFTLHHAAFTVGLMER